MAKAFEQKGNTSADKNNSVKTAEGKGLEEEWQCLPHEKRTR